MLVYSTHSYESVLVAEILALCHVLHFDHHYCHDNNATDCHLQVSGVSGFFLWQGC